LRCYSPPWLQSVRSSDPWARVGCGRHRHSVCPSFLDSHESAEV
jgi:hypothetical protein